jgi:hypothetical protein
MVKVHLHSFEKCPLTALAKRLCITSRDEAAGRCLSASLDLAVQARERHGLEVTLVKWRVLGDPHFVDHWAVLHDADTVLDLTRVQVDGRRQLVCALNSYPANFVNQRLYPASVVLADYVASNPTKGSRLSNGFLWACGTALFRFDVTQAWHQRNFSLARAALHEAGTFVKCFATSGLTRWLENRSRQLIENLQAQPNVSARSMRGVVHANPSSQTNGLQVQTKLIFWKASTLSLVANAQWYNVCQMASVCV